MHSQSYSFILSFFFLGIALLVGCGIDRKPTPNELSEETVTNSGSTESKHPHGPDNEISDSGPLDQTAWAQFQKSAPKMASNGPVSVSNEDIQRTMFLEQGLKQQFSLRGPFELKTSSLTEIETSAIRELIQLHVSKFPIPPGAPRASDDITDAVVKYRQDENEFSVEMPNAVFVF